MRNEPTTFAIMVLWAVLGVLLAAGCDSDSSGGADATAVLDGGIDANLDTIVSFDADFSIDAGFVGDPETCAEAALTHTYVGCDFYPTVLPNTVGKHFDYAVVVSNAGNATAKISIERGGKEFASGDVPPSGLKKFFLPWVDETKHWRGMCDTDMVPPARPTFESRRVPAGAYHLTSSVPVTVFQFNPLEYDPKGGPEGKDWSGCIKENDQDQDFCMFGCHSYTNDASLLLPSTAATPNYRITVPAGQDGEDVKQPGYFAVTGLHSGTQVKVQISTTGKVIGGDDIPDAEAQETFMFHLNQEEVVLIVGTKETDLSGTLLNASKPIQVMSGVPCHQMPEGYTACDHMEESVMPAETWGKRYFVSVPSNDQGKPTAHVVRIYGNRDVTNLTFSDGAPSNASPIIHAGHVYDLGMVDKDFEVSGDHEFAVTSFLVGGSFSSGGGSRGDPGQTNVMSVEQYRKKYVFLAPDDYDVSFTDIILPDGTQLTLDGEPVTAQPTPIANGYGVVRVKLGPGQDGAHVLEADQPVGLQVMGYGFATSYYYPGGLNLIPIAPPPVIE